MTSSLVPPSTVWAYGVGGLSVVVASEPSFNATLDYFGEAQVDRESRPSGLYVLMTRPLTRVERLGARLRGLPSAQSFRPGALYLPTGNHTEDGWWEFERE